MIMQTRTDLLKIDLARKLHLSKIPKNIELNLENPEINLKTKPVRTISGVAPIAIMTYPENCKHGSCTFCPGGPMSYFGDVPKSYTGNEPASMRAIRNNFDPYLQVFNRLEHYILMKHVPNKVELIIMGGTFPSYEISYQDEFITYAIKAMNDFSDMFFENNLYLKAGIIFYYTGALQSLANKIGIVEVEPSNKVDFSLAGEIKKVAIVYFIWENLLGNQYFITTYYPMPERNIRFGLSWELFN